MKRPSPLTFVLILLFSASLAFPQQSKLTLKDGKSNPATTSITGNCAYAVDSSKKPDDFRDITQPFPARGGSVDWGLALSGGGIRSGSFSIGAMKALYDLGFLDRIDVISSVSGGGYASYWLFMNYDQNKTQKFGEDAFKDDVFLKNVCNLPARTFFPLKSMLKAIFQKKDGAFESYETAIRDTFGNNEPVERTPKERKISYLKPSIDQGNVPYFIINTTLGTNEKNALCKVFELTPGYMGNPAVGFYKWTPKGENVLRWSESIAMSSAGVKWKLGRPLPNYASNIAELTKANLSDGGHSENLAAYSLIRRGVKKIIIVDAGHDPNYEFLDYRNLKNHLSMMGVDFYVEDIEKFLKTRKKKEVYSTASVSEGYAKSRPASAHKTPIDSLIYYVKMSKPKSIFAGKLQDDAAYDRGEEYSIERREKLEDSDWDCNSDSVAKYGFRSDMYIYTVKNYSEYLNRHWLWRKVGKKIPFFRYNFPQTTTMEQSFYRDQLEAFVGLGYLQALELEKHRDW